MSILSEQVKELRDISKKIKTGRYITDSTIGKNLEQAADTIEALSAKLSEENMDRSDRYYGSGWIACEDELPEDGVDVLVWFEYFRYGEHNRLFQTKGISYTFNGKWSGFVNGSSGWMELRIIAWQPLPEDYRP